MSPGELILFYFCIFTCTLTISGDASIILLDEPELHLHPKKVIELISVLYEELPNTVLWIATHSIHLIPFFDFSEITHINDGKITGRKSSTYNEIFSEMVGNTHKDLQIFLSSVDLWQYYEFIAECFCAPGTVFDNNTNDPQFMKFITFINNSYQQKQQIDVLDYGCGDGRFGNYIDLMQKDSRSEYKVNYYTYDEFSKKPTSIICHMEHWMQRNQLLNANKQFDCVIMVNVLHEIDIKDWLNVFLTIETVLKPNGYLFFCEAITLTSGEMPYGDSGYLVLSENQLRILFDDIVMIPLGQIGNRNERIVEKAFAAAISSESISRVTQNRVIKAIKSLQDMSNTVIEELFPVKQSRKQILDKKDKDNNIRKYAFYSQQYINAKMAYSTLNSNHRLDNSLETRYSEILKMEKEHDNKDEIIKMLEENAQAGHEKSANRLFNKYGIVFMDAD
jgi:SAM-dependent methyltransferase